MKNTHRKFLSFLMTAALLLAVSIPALAKEETTPPTCFISLTENALIISMDGKSYSYDVNSGGFQAEFYRYEPTNTVCIRFTDASGKTRAIAMGEELQLALSGAFESVTLNRSLGGTRFFLKSDADIKTFTVNSSGTVHIFGDAEKVAVYGAAQMFLQGEANVQKLSLLNSKSSLNAAKGTRVNNITRVPGASVSGGGSIGRMNSTVAETDGGSSFSDFNDDSSSSSDNGSSSVLEPSSPTPAPVKTVTIGTQQGGLVSGEVGGVYFNVTTKNIADGSGLTVNWNKNVTPTGVNTTFDKVKSNQAKVMMDGNNQTGAGSYPFTVTVDGVTSDPAILVIAPFTYDKTVTISSQQGKLTEGKTGSATFKVTTTNIADDEELTINWANGKPDGIIATYTKVISGMATVTINSNANTKAGQYPFTVTADGVKSSEATLVINPPASDKTVTIGTQQNQLTAGRPGRVFFSVSKKDLWNDSDLTVNWTNNVTPTGIIVSTTKMKEDVITIIMDGNYQTVAGNYSFTVTTTDGVTTDPATLVISE